MNSSFLFLLLTFGGAVFVSRYSAPVVGLLIKKFSLFLPSDMRAYLKNQSQLPYSLFILWLFCYFGFQFISMQSKWELFLKSPLSFLLTLSLLLMSWNFLDLLEQFIILKLKKRKDGVSDSFSKHLLPYLRKILKTLVAIFAILICLQNLGFNVTSILAGLGLGGVAVALAAKETLGNFFGGFTVIIDKPFSIGDWIICNNTEGTVEDIGFRSTKVKTFYDSVLTIPNSVIAGSVIDNLGKRQSRRTRITLDITYDTSPEKIEIFVEGIKNIIQSNPHTRKDYYQCYFSGYSPHSLQILLNFFLKVSDWDSELLQKQNIFLEILRLAKELEIEFAFPTQTLHVPSFPGQEVKKKKAHPH